MDENRNTMIAATWIGPTDLLPLPDHPTCPECKARQKPFLQEVAERVREERDRDE